MIKKFECIKSAGIFEDFRWASSTRDFAKINVLFGGNGSGKTSLSSAFESARHDAARQSLLSLGLDENGAPRSTDGKPDPIFERIYVFNEDYVKKAHKFSENNPTMAAVLTVGERSVEAEAELEVLRAELPDLTLKQSASEKDLAAADAGLQKIYERVSKSVVDALTTLGGKYQSRSKYSKGVVEKHFKTPVVGWTVLSDTQLQADKQLVLSDHADAIPSRLYSIDVRDSLAREASSLLGLTPATVVLDSLAAHPTASRWVQEGRGHHHDLGQCIFCGSELTDERKAAIDAHFSGAVAGAEADLQGLIGELRRIEGAAAQARTQVPPKSALYKDLRDGFTATALAYEQDLDAVSKWAQGLIERLNLKLSNVLAVVEDTTVEQRTSVAGSSLEAAIKQHNERVEKHDELLTQAATRIEHHHLKTGEQEVSASKSAMTEASDAIQVAKTAVRDARDRVAALENVEGDPMPSVDVLNSEVTRLLGRADLKFEEHEGRYRVTRHGMPAIGLSEGERTAITLIHFMEVVARHDAAGGKPIVIIDDPVSSLDSNIFMGVSTYIWTECVSKIHVEQLFLLTHNFELFRQWDVQVEALHKGGGMKRAHPAELYEISSKHAQVRGRTSRRPHITSWPPSETMRKKVRSTYHHAFLSVVAAKDQIEEDDSLERRLDAQLLFPNVIRRMLETFLGFKRPDGVGDFTKMMRDTTELLNTSGYAGDADALRQQLTRYAHAYSHSETPDTTMTINPDEIAPAISAVFTFMHQLDPGHFNGLCTVIDRDPEELLNLKDPYPSQSDSTLLTQSN